MPYVVTLEQFEGPLDLLLQLIEKEELSITEVSLAAITDGYLEIVRGGQVVPEELADFLVVASKLILLKSQRLLPGLAMEAEEGPSLEAQLKLYREFVEASKKINALLLQKRMMFGREKPLIERVVRFSPPPSLTLVGMVTAFRSVLANLEPIIKFPKAAIERAISIQEKMAHIRATILERATISFRELLADAKTKTEVIVHFLALLELVKQRIVDIHQEALFEDITLRRSEGKVSV